MFYRKAPSYRGKRLWNKLPLHIQAAESKVVFKTKVKGWFGTDLKGKRERILKVRKEKKKVRKKRSFDPP